MPETTVLGLRHPPAAGVLPDVPYWNQALAEDTEAALTRRWFARPSAGLNPTTTTPTLIPGLSLTVVVPAGKTWTVWVDAGITARAGASGTTVGELYVDGVAQGGQMITTSARTGLTGAWEVTLAAGSHTLQIRGSHVTTSGQIENTHGYIKAKVA